MPGYNESGIASATFTVGMPGVLDVFPTNGFSASGTVGGPFSPSEFTYTLTNSGGASLSWTAGANQDWLSLSASNGALAAGGSEAFTVSFNSNADALPAGSHTGMVTLVDAATGAEVQYRTIEITPNAILTLLPPIQAMSGQVQVTLQGQPYQTYVIEASAGLVQWIPIVTNAAGVDGMLIHEDADSGEERRRFYRGRTH
jgi:hypothetical protein